MAQKHTVQMKASPAAKNPAEDRRQHQERRLREREKELMRDMAETVAQARSSNIEDAQDVADQAVAGYQKEMLFTQGTARNTQLHMVRQALRRVAEGTYGECIRCDRTIGAKRIDALPWTPYCIDCQELIEKGEIEPSAVA